MLLSPVIRYPISKSQLCCLSLIHGSYQGGPQAALVMHYMIQATCRLVSNACTDRTLVGAVRRGAQGSCARSSHSQVLGSTAGSHAWPWRSCSCRSAIGCLLRHSLLLMAGSCLAGLCEMAATGLNLVRPAAQLLPAQSNAGTCLYHKHSLQQSPVTAYNVQIKVETFLVSA